MNKNALSTTTVTDSTAILHAVLHSSQDAMVITAGNGIIEAWNPSAEALFGYTEGEVKGKNITLIIPVDQLAEYINSKTQACGSAEHKYYNCTRRRKNGTLIRVGITLSHISQGDEQSNFLMVYKEINTHTLQQARVSQSHLQAIFNHAEEGFVLIDRNSVIKAFNAKAKESIVLSYNDSEVEAGQSIFNYIEDKRKAFFTEMITAVLEGKSLRYDRSYPKPDGTTAWFNFSLNPVREDNEITGICITGNDITKRKIAEQLFEANEKRFRGLVENSGDAVSILKADGTPTYVSPSIKKILGYTDEQSLSMNLFSIIHPQDLPDVRKLWKKILETPGIPFYDNICRIRHSSGAWRWINGTITNMLHDPAIDGIVDNFRDITSTIEADKKLRVSEERYKYLFYNNPLPMWIYDPKTWRFLEVNDATIVKYGYSRNEFLQLTLKDIRSKEEANKLEGAVSGRSDKKYNKGGTWTHLTKSKEVLYVEISSHPVQYEGVDAILVLSNDITEKHIASQLLLEAYEENTNILESITDGFLTVDKDWTVTYWNKEAEHMLSIPRNIILGKNIWDVFEKETHDNFYQQYTHALVNQVAVTFEERVPDINLWLEVTCYPSAKGLSIYFKDITEKKRIEENTKEAIERYEMVAKATSDAIFELDAVNYTIYWGEGYTKLFGHPVTSEAMPLESWTDNLHPDEVEKLTTQSMEALKRKDTILSREFRFRCANGEYKTVIDKLLVIYGENGRAVKMVGAIQDITDRKNHELAIASLNEQLNMRAEELANSNEELEQFAYVASHDLQEPLRMVGSFLQLLQRKYDNQLDATANQYINFAVDGADRMKRLILDLLEYSRVGTNKDVMTNVAMSEIAQTIQKNYHTADAETTPVFHVSLLPEVRANKMQVMQLLQNLVGNAIKYNTSAVPEIWISSEDTGTHWQFAVKDNGIGIEQKFLDKVFVIFQRLHNKNKYSGTGIGLAICKKIVERHGGVIWIESVPEQGSTFYFTIKK